MSELDERLGALTDDEIREQLLSRITAPIWPHVGRAYDLSRGSAYLAARTGAIPAKKINGRWVGLCGPICRELGIMPRAEAA